MKLLVSIFFLLTAFNVNAVDLSDSWDILKRSRGSSRHYPVIIKELVNNKLYFTSMPYIKEYLATTKVRNNKEIDLLIDQVVTQVGVKQLEVMPISFLTKSNAPTIQYILAKKYFRLGKYKRSLKHLNGTIPREHSIKPFAILLEASIHSIQKKYQAALDSYNECIDITKNDLKKIKDVRAIRQLKINRDYCIVGIARTFFANKQYEQAHSAYLDLSKNSHIWPEVLFEEAWNSFYLKDYNRTLGKLVTYKAPILQFIFNPEIDVLKALTYYELCLWDDVKKVVDQFYANNRDDHKVIWSLLKKNRKDYKYYYLLAKTRKAGKKWGNKLLARMLDSITRDPTYQELYSNFLRGRYELSVVKKVTNKSFRKILLINLKESLLLQRNLIGAYVRKQLHMNQKEMTKMFQNLSYLKLEVLSYRKERIYNPEAKIGRGRGDIRHLKRTDKQYFWNFNGEFWADELGDYVFSLKSECRNL